MTQTDIRTVRFDFTKLEQHQATASEKGFQTHVIARPGQKLFENKFLGENEGILYIKGEGSAVDKFVEAITVDPAQIEAYRHRNAQRQGK